MSLSIAWLRHDLRLSDNPLLRFELPPRQLLCVYVLDRAWLRTRECSGMARIGPARLRFLWESLIALRGELLKRGSDLLVRVGDPVEVVVELVHGLGADQVRVRRDAGWDETQATVALAKRLGEEVDIWQPDSGLLLDEPSLPMPLDALPRSFSSFRRQVERSGPFPAAGPAPVTLPPWPEGAPRGLPPLNQVCPAASDWWPDARGEYRFAGGEAEGVARLDHYLWETGAVASYKQTRNGLRGADFSTRLSPWLAHGCLSARQVHDAMRSWEARHGASESSYWITFELLWRDYFHWAARQEGRALYGPCELPVPGAAFRAWRDSRTGVPLIDAAMRELASTGWLSNRARQNVASFLVKALGGDWRLGAAWFEQCLVDYDAASNWGNWRYVAGVGRNPRASRDFNVLYQAQRYDARGDYVAHWLPALRRLPPGRVRHQPWGYAPDAFSPPLVTPPAWRK